jgi:hypothetical protein
MRPRSTSNITRTTSYPAVGRRGGDELLADTCGGSNERLGRWWLITARNGVGSRPRRPARTGDGD